MADGLVFTRHADLVEVSALLNDLNLLEFLSELSDELEAVSLHEEELDQSGHSDLSLVDISLSKQVRADATFLDLVNDESINPVILLKGLSCVLKTDSLSKFALKTNLISESCKLVEVGFSDLDLKLIASGELVLNVLRASEAAEDSTTDHDSHLGRQSLCLFHRMSSQDDGALLVTLRDFLDYRPHETASFWVHTSRGLIKQHNRWVSNDGDSHGKFALVSAREGASRLAAVIS